MTYVITYVITHVITYVITYVNKYAIAYVITYGITYVLTYDITYVITYDITYVTYKTKLKLDREVGGGVSLGNRLSRLTYYRIRNRILCILHC